MNCSRRANDSFMKTLLFLFSVILIISIFDDGKRCIECRKSGSSKINHNNKDVLNSYDERGIHLQWIRKRSTLLEKKIQRETNLKKGVTGKSSRSPVSHSKDEENNNKLSVYYTSNIDDDGDNINDYALYYEYPKSVDCYDGCKTNRCDLGVCYALCYDKNHDFYVQLEELTEAMNTRLSWYERMIASSPEKYIQRYDGVDGSQKDGKISPSEMEKAGSICFEAKGTEKFFCKPCKEYANFIKNKYG